MNQRQGRGMTIEIISWSISTKVWDRARIKLATTRSAVRCASVVRHVTDCAMLPGKYKYEPACIKMVCYFGTYQLSNQEMLRQACVSAQSCQSHIKYGRRWRHRLCIMYVAPLGSCICMFKEWFYACGKYQNQYVKLYACTVKPLS